MTDTTIYNKLKPIVWDIDGTLSDTAWRLHLIKEKPKSWPKFIESSQRDNPILQTQYIYHALAALPDSVMIKMTARAEPEREITSTWLTKHGFDPSIMFMRPEKDNRPDWEVKSEMLDRIEEIYGKVFMAFEDRPGVIKECYNKKGIFVLDVGNGTAT
jgi:phosphoglycolate phosphatase-like HAD superfamily hydrolase